ncbi:hypothetical protein M0638_02920 [Roseomonas sp. NAR14]|uniref:Uncharacterized protein n=1 Tax=Roseomonas acroporae TaxID=2937791 RepID=A0A9X1Y371_9PROT|nr:hypothetical protein [Roseomonas acroporae]MCK8783334.1 hypothetical protein [Roseomonas acroporae]
MVRMTRIAAFARGRLPILWLVFGLPAALLALLLAGAATPAWRALPVLVLLFGLGGTLAVALAPEWRDRLARRHITP